MGKKIENIKNNQIIFEEYFKEDMAAIEEELEQSKKYSKIINEEIEKLSDSMSLGVSKGSQHYLIEHIKNAVALQTQRQGLRKDKFAIKKSIMDYASKFDDGDASEESTLQDLLNKIIAEGKSSKNVSLETTIVNNENLDDEIDNILGDE